MHDFIFLPFCRPLMVLLFWDACVIILAVMTLVGQIKVGMSMQHAKLPFTHYFGGVWGSRLGDLASECILTKYA